MKLDFALGQGDVIFKVVIPESDFSMVKPFAYLMLFVSVAGANEIDGFFSSLQEKRKIMKQVNRNFFKKQNFTILKSSIISPLSVKIKQNVYFRFEFWFTLFLDNVIKRESG